MNTILASLISDGQGNSSAMRVVFILVPVAIIVAKFYNAYLLKSPVTFDTADVELMVTVVGGKLIQNKQEK